MKRARVWRRLGFIVLGLLLYLVFLVALAPAEYFARAISLLSGHGITLQKSEGTFWEGTAVLALPASAKVPSAQLQWSIHPWRLLTGAVALDLQLAGAELEARGTIEASVLSRRVRDLAVAVPVRVVAALNPASDVVGLGGRMRLTSPTLEISANAVQGSAELLWEGASSRLLPVTPIGDYKLQISGQGKRMALRLSTLQGQLQVAGEGEWRAFEDGTFRFQGTLVPTTPQPTLEPMLNAIGPAQADGRRTFTFERKLSLAVVPGLLP